ncbi:uncharacterized protein tnfrsf13b [Stegastes partitus]|uniref:Uncharacterized protein tnfrsf13b n=2 Tax=Stegastes partitus TaxID=144197 RepID=A0A9Y4N9S0_9TELE|nr:PREDICTED: uncharacterized protein LOC103364077 [Stegastes partitus]
MGGSCHDGHHYDPLLRKCVECLKFCRQSYVPSKCASYCEAAHCKAVPGHYFDRLLKKCIKCTDICGRHTAECSQHCQTPSPPMTTKKSLVEVTSQVSISRRPTWLEDSNILIYSLLAVSMVLLLASLSLALAAFLKGSKAKSSKPSPSNSTNRKRKCGVQQRQEVGFLGCPTGMNSTGFPDLKALGQGNNRQQRAPFLVNQPAVLQRAQNQNGGPLWPEGSLHTSGQKVQEGAAVG